MDMHAMTLPGFAGPRRRRGTMECSGQECFGQIPTRAEAGDTEAAWADALRQGKGAISAYLETYKADHAQGCRYRELPPSIHIAAAAGGRRPDPHLEKALAALKEARNREG